MNTPIKLAIHGASGRNGRRLIALGTQDHDVQLVGALVGPTSKHLNEDAGTLAGQAAIGLKLSDQWPDAVDAVIDFSSPEGCMAAVDKAVLKKVPLVIATTGLTPQQIERIQQASTKIPICYAPNMSVAVNVAMKLVEQAAKVLKAIPGGVDVEIIERHHRMKETAPAVQL